MNPTYHAFQDALSVAVQPNDSRSIFEPSSAASISTNTALLEGAIVSGELWLRGMGEIISTAPNAWVIHERFILQMIGV